MMMTGNETARRRRVQGRNSESSDIQVTGPGSRSSTSISHNVQHHHYHHHEHQHHHYHYHYHHFPRQLSGEQDQTSSLSGSRIGDQTMSASTHMPNLREIPLVGSTQEASTESRGRLDERLSTMLSSHRQNSTGLAARLFDEFNVLFDEEEDVWSDDELWELGIEDWLAAWDLQERWHTDLPSASEQVSASTGLSKAFIRQLHKEVYVPKGSTGDSGAGYADADCSEQDDCSVCLEGFLSGQLLISLPCKHRFHPDCLSPWLESRGQCPYCRANIKCEERPESSSRRQGGGSAFTLSEDELLAWMEVMDSGLSRLSER